MPRDDGCLLVFARAPVPGAVKTRLVPRLGEEGAARLHRWLVERTLQVAAEAGFARLSLYCTPDARHPFLVACARRYGAELRVQVGADLGERMHSALAAELQTARYAVLIGCDCPMLSTVDLNTAGRHLRAGEDAALGPSVDGGYVLIGLREPAPSLFAGLPWGSDGVLAATRQRLAALGWRWFELPELWDLDRPADLDRLASMPGCAAAAGI
ncbi:MAG: TIGR04282 family arsenosugar biosynthesis glycosyltransferase [Gammaproteobacteria bacterium]